MLGFIKSIRIPDWLDRVSIEASRWLSNDEIDESRQVTHRKLPTGYFVKRAEWISEEKSFNLLETILFLLDLLRLLLPLLMVFSCYDLSKPLSYYSVIHLFINLFTYTKLKYKILRGSTENHEANRISLSPLHCSTNQKIIERHFETN